MADGAASAAAPRFSFLPPLGSRGYYILVGAAAMLVLGPIAGVAAAYMNFSIGFFLSGQVLAGILGSAVTFGYGANGKHGANYIQTMAASVGGMAGLGVLIQTMIWLGLAEPPTWQLIAYFLCVGMFGAGVGMLYTPVVIDRMQLTFPSGLAVANILRALTDPLLLRRSIARLGGGFTLGAASTLAAEKGGAAFLSAINFSASTFGAGIIVGARIGVPAIVVGLIGLALTPWLRDLGLLGPNDPWRKVGFLISLGAILGAAIVDITLISREAWRRRGAPRAQAAEDWKRVNTHLLIAWVVAWGIGVVVAATLLGVPLRYAVMGVAFGGVFVLVNGISMGISDSNPISSAFVVSVTVMALAGLTDPLIALVAGSIVLVSCVVGGDMQQDRSTGARLGTNRVIQFRYQVLGVLMGALLAVVLAKLFIAAYPVLKVDTFLHPEMKTGNWQSAMTYKFAGVLRGLTSAETTSLKLMGLGIAIGIVTEVLRKALAASPAYQTWKMRSSATRAADFIIDAIVIPSPYASSFGGFVEWWTSFWFGAGGIFSSAWNTLAERRNSGTEPEHADMSTMSLLGGGLIAGEAITFLTLGVIGLVALAR
jgi:uncharacterized oligopeptide transporter (OPT) family protein